MHAFREWVIEKGRDEANIIAPCPHHGECPMARHPDQWCHFSQLTQKVPNDVFPKRNAEPDVVNEKFSYLTVQKHGPSTKSEKEATTPREQSVYWPRIVRPVIKKHKHAIMDLCSPESAKTGLLERRIIAKSHGLEGGYRMARKARWGDLWYFRIRVPHKFRKEGPYGKRLW